MHCGLSLFNIHKSFAIAVTNNIQWYKHRNKIYKKQKQNLKKIAYYLHCEKYRQKKCLSMFTDNMISNVSSLFFCFLNIVRFYKVKN